VIAACAWGGSGRSVVRMCRKRFFNLWSSESDLPKIETGVLAPRINLTQVDGSVPGNREKSEVNRSHGAGGRIWKSHVRGEGFAVEEGRRRRLLLMGSVPSARAVSTVCRWATRLRRRNAS